MNCSLFKVARKKIRFSLLVMSLLIANTVFATGIPIFNALSIPQLAEQVAMKKKQIEQYIDDLANQMQEKADKDQRENDLNKLPFATTL